MVSCSTSSLSGSENSTSWICADSDFLFLSSLELHVDERLRRKLRRLDLGGRTSHEALSSSSRVCPANSAAFIVVPGLTISTRNQFDAWFDASSYFHGTSTHSHTHRHANMRCATPTNTLAKTRENAVARSTLYRSVMSTTRTMGYITKDSYGRAHAGKMCGCVHIWLLRVWPSSREMLSAAKVAKQLHATDEGLRLRGPSISR